MKIIKEGNAEPKVKRFSCNYCGCVFEADETEYRPLADAIAYMKDGIDSFCICPCCEKTAYA